VKSVAHLPTTLAIDTKSPSSQYFSLAKAHAVLARCCALNPLIPHSAALAKTAHSCSSYQLTLANAYVATTKSLASNWHACRSAILANTGRRAPSDRKLSLRAAPYTTLTKTV